MPNAFFTPKNTTITSGIARNIKDISDQKSPEHWVSCEVNNKKIIFHSKDPVMIENGDRIVCLAKQRGKKLFSSTYRNISKDKCFIPSTFHAIASLITSSLLAILAVYFALSLLPAQSFGGFKSKALFGGLYLFAISIGLWWIKDSFQDLIIAIYARKSFLNQFVLV